MRPTSCPWQALRDPFVAAVMRAHDWYRERQLEARYGGRIPEALARGVELYAIALSIVRAEETRLDREERERERGRTTHGGPRPRLPQFRRGR